MINLCSQTQHLLGIRYIEYTYTGLLLFGKIVIAVASRFRSTVSLCMNCKCQPISVYGM